MAELTRGQKRSEVILRAKIAFKKGLSASKFLSDMKARGLSYRRTDMLSDWRSVNQLERKADAFKYVRKDRMPTARVIAQVDWSLSREYMYKIKIQSRTRPGEPILDRFVNIMQDRPRTPGEIEALAWSLIQKQSPKLQAQVVAITPWTVLQKVIE